MPDGAPTPTRFWLTFDLGINDDSTALFDWLDRHDAAECGDVAATFTSTQTFAELAAELQSALRAPLYGAPRVYLIGPFGGAGAVKGAFVVGRRHRHAPWHGCATVEDGEDDEPCQA